jgi:alanine racemase
VGRRATIEDVAREAGVSPTSVSFAFNSPERLSADTLARIRAVAAELAYRPHPVARMLAARRTATIGILIPHALDKVFGNPYYGLFLQGASAAIADRGLGLLFVSPLEGSLAMALERATTDGIIVVGLDPDHPEIEDIRQAGVPMVSVDAPAWPEHGAVEVADEAGARAAASHLVALGHRDILVMSIGPSTVEHGVAPGPLVRHRLQGYRTGFATVATPVHEMVISADATVESGDEEFQTAWERGVRPSAVLCMSDAMAIGVLQAARRLGIAVPEQLSVVGFDDLPMSTQSVPPLTTVHQPVRQKGELAARLLIAALDAKPGAPGERRMLDTELVVRASTAPPSTTRPVI